MLYRCAPPDSTISEDWFFLNSPQLLFSSWFFASSVQEGRGIIISLVVQRGKIWVSLLAVVSCYAIIYKRLRAFW